MNIMRKARTALGAYPDTDILGILHADHERISGLTSELTHTPSTTARRKLLNELKPLLVAHCRAEESAVYAPLMELKAVPDARLAGAEGVVEHNLADLILERLAFNPDPSSEMWTAHAKVLHECVQRHFAEEEKVIFEALVEQFSIDQLETMAEHYQLNKKKLLKPRSGGVLVTRMASNSAA